MKTVWTLIFALSMITCITRTGVLVSSPHDEYLQIDDGTIAFRSIGSDQTIVFIAGGPGICGPLYEEMLSKLGDKNKIIFWSYAGCGKSFTKRSKPSIAGDLNDLNALVSTLPKPVILMGHSYGGMLGIKYASKYPKEVIGLILVNSMPAFNHAQESMLKKVARLSELGLKEEYFQLGEKVFSGRATTIEMQQFWKLESNLQVSNTKYAKEISEKLIPAFGIITGMQSDLMAVNFTNELKKLKIPVLITAGSDDLVALDQPKKMSLLLPGANYHEYTKSGHSPFLEENDLFIDQTSSWLKKNSFR